MKPEYILVIPAIVGLITLLYVNEEKIRAFLGLPQREVVPEVKEHLTELGTFFSTYGEQWEITLDGKEWRAKDLGGAPDPAFLARIPDVRRALPIWERKVREAEELNEYILSSISQEAAEDEVLLTFTRREFEGDMVLFVTMRGGEIVDSIWID